MERVGVLGFKGVERVRVRAIILKICRSSPPQHKYY